jgi:hypothetical protein
VFQGVFFGASIELIKVGVKCKNTELQFLGRAPSDCGGCKMQKKLSCNFFVELHLIKVGVKDFELQFLGRAPSD